MTYEVMPDFTGGAVFGIPNYFVAVGGYVTGTAGLDGTPDIIWTEADWNKYSNAAVRLRYNQGYDSPDPDPTSYDVLDVETGAWTINGAAEQVYKSVQAGIVTTTIYGSEDTIYQVGEAVISLYGREVWDGHVNCILADWNLNEAEAAALLGTQVREVTCVGVQWASPTSNPDTILPGTHLTLTQANADLNVLLAGWKPDRTAGQIKPPTTTPTPTPTPTPTAVFGVVVWGNGTATPATRAVKSTDKGATWQ